MKTTRALGLCLLIGISGAVFADTGDIPMLFYGEASWYGEQFHGRLTASGEVYDMNMLSAAHKTLPFGTLLRVTNLENDKSVTVRVNDRGPFVNERVLDLSRAAAALLEFQNKGTAKIEARVVQIGDGRVQTGNTPANAAPGGQSTQDVVREQQNTLPAVKDDVRVQQDTPKDDVRVQNPDTVRIIRPEDVRTTQPSAQETQPVQQQTDWGTVADPHGRFVIQAGAFLSLDNAEGLLARFQGMGLPAFLRQLPGDRWQRVWIGPFASRAAAETQLGRVRSISDQAYICARE